MIISIMKVYVYLAIIGNCGSDGHPITFPVVLDLYGHGSAHHSGSIRSVCTHMGL